MPPVVKPIHLPWHHADAYWICVFPREAVALPLLRSVLIPLGYKEVQAHNGYFQLMAEKQWGGAWQALFQALVANNLPPGVDIAIIAGETEPDEHVILSRKTVTQVQTIAEALWLGDAVLTENVLCYLQPVMVSPGETFGYESFARVRTATGTIVTGEAIVTGAKALGIEYGIDRLLQVNAVKTYAASGCGGYLFVNFFPGFIQRPEVYLEGLTDTVSSHGVPPTNVVLDFTRCETPHDVQHIRRVTEYCRTKGYAIALDDLLSVANAKQLLQEVKPDYLKLDMKLVRRVENSNDRADIGEIVQACHAHGTKVIAEGVETEVIFNLLKELNIDLFQGYLFAPPLPVEEVKKFGNAAAKSG